MSNKVRKTMPNSEIKTHALLPRLRFPEFQKADVWEMPELKDITLPVEERVGERQLTPVSISAGVGFVPQAEKFGRDISGNQYKLYTVVRDGDFVYNKGNSLKFPQGCVYDLHGWGEVAAPNVFICFRLKPEYENVFFRYCFERNIHGLQLKKHITSGARSNGLLNISKEAFFGVKIPTPKLAEQQKIADCLYFIDEIISAETEKLDTLKTYKKGLMQSLFPAEGEHVPKLRFPEFVNSASWTIMPLNQLAKRCVLKNKDGKINRVLTNSAEYGVLDQREYFDKDIANQGNLDTYYVVMKGDYVYNPRISISAPVGPISKNHVATGVMSPLYTVFRFDNKHNEFYSHYFKTTAWHGYMRQASSTGARHDRMAITNDNFMAIPIPVTSEEEQKKIADFLSSIDALIFAETNKLDALKSFKKGLMQQLFPTIKEGAE